jgi:hypothetical protein
VVLADLHCPCCQRNVDDDSKLRLFLRWLSGRNRPSDDSPSEPEFLVTHVFAPWTGGQSGSSG